MQRLLAISLITALSGACGTDPSGDDHGYGDGLGDPENPVPQSAGDGPYATRTMMDFTVEAILPPQAELVVVTMRSFGENPAKTLITVADEAGLAVADELYSVIPSALRDKFEGWVNGAISKLRINGKTIPEYSAQVAMLAETALTKFAIDSDLAIEPGTATHTLTGIDLSPAGIDVHVPISGYASDILTQHPTVQVGAAGELMLGDQTFGLRIGEYLWQGVNAQVTNLFGGDILTSLTDAVDCAAIAKEVADKCVLNVCVGHETQIRQVCTSSLNLIVEQMHEVFAKLNLDAFHMIQGDARLVDDTGDGIADRILDGVWDSEMNLGLGMRKAPSTFSGMRDGAPISIY